MTAAGSPITAVIGGRTLWYLTRGTGVVTLLLLTASVALGALTSVRWESARWPRFVTTTLHRNVSLLVLVFLVAHIVTTVADGFVPIRWIDTVIPFESAYRPVWLGLGAVAFDLLLALTISSLLRERVGPTAWRLIHWSAYACWPLAIVHGLGTGFDTREGWMIAVNAACVALVQAAVAWRVATAEPRSPGVRVAAAGLAVAFPIVLGAFAVSGPMKAGWQHKKATVARGIAFAGPTGPVRGTVTQQAYQGGTATELIDLVTSGAHPVRVQVSLTGRRLTGGSLAAPTGSVSLGTVAGVVTASGPVTQIKDGVITAGAARATDGSTLAVTLDLTVDHQQGTARGTVASHGTGSTTGGGS